jgi:hypothetical protein
MCRDEADVAHRAAQVAVGGGVILTQKSEPPTFIS